MKKFISFICAVSLIVVCVISLFFCEFSTYSGVMNAETRLTQNITREYHIIDKMLEVRADDTLTLVVVRDGVEIAVDICILENCLTSY